jgi:hypothetical protein
MELVPNNVSEKDLREEVLRRNAKAGYTARNGECPRATRIQSLNPWGEAKLNIWRGPRDKDGNPIW